MRSSDAYRAGHIKGAVNLPFTDFTAESLALVIGNKDRPILIYSNNNFRNDRPPVPMKLVQLALNIQTFINLVGYGYGNVHELGETVDFDDPKVGWVAAEQLAVR
jgi:phage shock protein E